MKNLKEFRAMKNSGEQIVMITAYDFSSGLFVQEAGADLILVGDSLGMVIKGNANTLKVSLDDMIYHSQAARKGADDTFIIADLPHASYHISLTETRRNALRLYSEADVNAVKLEGGSETRLEAIKAIIDCEIPVCAHLGLTPQSIGTMGGYHLQGLLEEDYIRILNQAKDVEAAGAFMLVVECIPEKLGKEIAESLDIPVIGIGAGRFTDGQVLVYHDILGMSTIKPKFVKQYADLKTDITNYLSNWKTDVKSGNFPEEKHVYKPLKDKNNQG